MNLMICMHGDEQHLPYLAEIAALGAGIELGSYGLSGVKSESDWAERLARHQAVRARFQGELAIHGPFIGMEYAHIDHLIQEAVQRRLDMTFKAALQLNASRVVLHSSYKPENDLFNLQEPWLNGNVAFWQREIGRWAEAGILVVLENDIESSPDLLVRLVKEVNHPHLGLCLDVGHQHVFSELGALEWVRRMGMWLWHVHLHDNDGTYDQHWALGRGTIDLRSFYAALLSQVQQVTLALEVVDEMEVKMGDLRRLAAML